MEIWWKLRNTEKEGSMLTINQANLFYAAEYALAALLLLLCTWQRETLDIRRQIGRKVFFRRLLLVLFVSVPGIALMTGIYFIRLEPEVRFAAVGAVQFFMTVCNSVILGSSFFQRYRVYPRGSARRRYLSSCMGYRISLCPAK